MSKLSFLLQMARGQLGKKIVVKHYGKKVVVTRYPDMTRIKPSTAQKKQRDIFGKAVRYAQRINNDPIQKAAYKKKLKQGQTVYQAAIKEYLEKQQLTK